MANPTNKFTTSTTGTYSDPPVALLAVQRLDAVIGSIIQLDGRKSYAPSKRPLTFYWKFNQVPIGSNVATTGLRSLRPNSSAVAFTPDKIGVYVVQLHVNDSELDSGPVSVTVNVQLSRVPVGESIIPDAHFLWRYISNFWNLVEDRELITTIWSSVIQVAGAELIKLWGIDYNKSLKTIQTNTQRRWMKYEATTSLVEDVQQRVIVGKTSDGTNGKSGALGEEIGAGTTSVFAVPFGTGLGEADFSALEGNYGVKGRVISINGEGHTFSVVKRGEESSIDYSLALLAESSLAEGVVGATWRVPHLLHTPGVHLEEEGVRTGDVLVFQVIRADSNLTAELRAQVVCVDGYRLGFEFTLEDLEPGSPTIERALFRQLVQDLRIVPVGTDDASISAAAESLISFIPPGINLASRPFTTYRLKFKAKEVIHNTVLKAPDEVVSVPALQEQVKEPPVVLRENLDYIVESGKITFESELFTLREPTPRQFWAENTVLDNASAVEANFGTLVNLSRDDLTKKKTQAPYLSAVKGLMYAYTNGPTIANIRLGLHILMGLPFTEDRGLILERDDEFTFSTANVSLGRLLIEDVDAKNVRTGFRRLYFYPTDVGVEDHPVTGEPYKIGDIVEAFRPLSKGVEVIDYINTPDWWRSALGGLEILKYFTFKVTMDHQVFNDNDVGFALEFVKNIKPSYTNAITTILSDFVDEIDVEDVLGGHAQLNFYNNPWGLEATNRTDDDNHLGVTLWPMGHPLETRSLRVVRDLVTVKVGTEVHATSVTGFGASRVRGRNTVNVLYAHEGDLLFLHQGQLGSGSADPGVYEIDEVIDENTLHLGWHADLAGKAFSGDIVIDEDLFEYGTELTGVVMRREVNPIVQGADLSVAGADLVESLSSAFLVDGVGPGDHLIIFEGPNEGEYLIDAITPSPLPPTPFVAAVLSDTQLRLRLLFEQAGSNVPSLAADATPRVFRVIRPILHRRQLTEVQSRYNGPPISDNVLRTVNVNGIHLDSFTPSMVGMSVEVSNSDNPANDGVRTITAFHTPGLVSIDGGLGAGFADVAHQGVVALGDTSGCFERIDELVPTGNCEFSLKGDSASPAFNYFGVAATNQLSVSGSYAPQGTAPYNVPYTLDGPADIGTNPIQLGFKKGDKLRLTAHLSGGAGNDVGRVLTLVDPSTITVLENDLTVDGSAYSFEVFRRMSV